MTYLKREGVTRDGKDAALFGNADGPVDGGAFAERCTDDRHHVRFIVSPEDAGDLADIRAFTSDLVRSAIIKTMHRAMTGHGSTRRSTWLDRQLISSEPEQPGGEFGAEVDHAKLALPRHLFDRYLSLTLSLPGRRARIGRMEPVRFQLAPTTS